MSSEVSLQYIFKYAQIISSDSTSTLDNEIGTPKSKRQKLNHGSYKQI